MSELIFLDADNTLWDTNSVYGDAQEWLLAEIERLQGLQAQTETRLAYVRAVDQELAHRHHAGLGYPSRLLARALGFVLEGDPVERAAKRAWSDNDNGMLETVAAAMEVEFGRRLGAMPALRPGVVEAIDRFKHAGMTTVVLTEGSRPRVLRTLNHHGLAQQIDKVIQARKDERLFRRAKRLTGRPKIFMVGDQLDRDIAPAKAAGLETIYFPGGFAPRWAPEVIAVGPDHIVTSLADAADIVLDRASAFA